MAGRRGPSKDREEPGEGGGGGDLSDSVAHNVALGGPDTTARVVDSRSDALIGGDEGLPKLGGDEILPKLGVDLQKSAGAPDEPDDYLEWDIEKPIVDDIPRSDSSDEVPEETIELNFSDGDEPDGRDDQAREGGDEVPGRHEPLLAEFNGGHVEEDVAYRAGGFGTGAAATGPPSRDLTIDDVEVGVDAGAVLPGAEPVALEPTMSFTAPEDDRGLFDDSDDSDDGTVGPDDESLREILE